MQFDFTALAKELETAKNELTVNSHAQESGYKKVKEEQDEKIASLEKSVTEGEEKYKAMESSLLEKIRVLEENANNKPIESAVVAPSDDSDKVKSLQAEVEKLEKQVSQNLVAAANTVVSGLSAGDSQKIIILEEEVAIQPKTHTKTKKRQKERESQ